MAKKQVWRQQSGYNVRSIAQGNQMLYRQTKQYQKSPFSRLGAVGTFPTEILIEIRLTKIGQQVVDGTYVYRPKKGVGVPLGHAQGVSYTNIITQLKEYVYKPLVEHVTNYINFDVPSDTNRLRETMIKSMGARYGASQTSQISNMFPFKIAINTGDLHYAKPVNNMPTLIRTPIGYMGLRHPPERFHGDVRNDPEARQYWWEHVTRIGRNHAGMLFTKFHSRFFRRYLQKYKKQNLIPKSWNGTHIFKAKFR